MTPEEFQKLEGLIRELLQKNDSSIWPIIIITVVVVLVSLFLSSYVKKIGEKLATKEDIEDITKKVEAIKSEYNAQTERLKVELSKDLHMHQLQFEKEFEIYAEIWEMLVELQTFMRILQALRVIGSETPKNQFETEEDIDVEEHIYTEEDIRKQVNDLWWQFVDLIHKRRPFYSPNIYNNLLKLMKLIAKEPDFFRYSKTLITNEDLTNIKNNDKQITEAISFICKDIRNRIFERH